MLFFDVTVSAGNDWKEDRPRTILCIFFLRCWLDGTDANRVRAGRISSVTEEALMEALGVSASESPNAGGQPPTNQS
ncbi:hypothetical protein MSLAZ_1732 [Methanosarcina lacustris Z-7289]|uniref:Uncharacterized protein n=1 Tax=Methanosarcina lacustris Z-7289 TaxID=1434111 RepID=A0A0E3S7I9_9EURY|nr:hypothetical protein [Methanosarcina lacustris]AKB74993.1 hypothetical protein MSLAZ_1732 [Methanosarcina lacustris Z-7289]